MRTQYFALINQNLKFQFRAEASFSLLLILLDHHLTEQERERQPDEASAGEAGDLDPIGGGRSLTSQQQVVWMLALGKVMEESDKKDNQSLFLQVQQSDISNKNNKNPLLF